jgi:hypothetical protein
MAEIIYRYHGEKINLPVQLKDYLLRIFLIGITLKFLKGSKEKYFHPKFVGWVELQRNPS